MTLLEKIGSKVLNFFKDVYHRKSQIISISNDGKLWRIKTRVFEGKHTAAGPAKKDLPGIYEVLVDQALEIVAYELVSPEENSTPVTSGKSPATTALPHP